MSVVPFISNRADARFTEITDMVDDHIEDDVDILLLVAVRAALNAGRGGVRLAATPMRLDAALDVIV